MTAPAPPCRRCRRLRRLAVSGLLLLVLLLAGAAAGLAALWHSESALRWGLAQVPGLRAEGLRGHFGAGRLELDRLDWALPGGAGRLRVQGLRLAGLQWRWQAGRPALRVAELRALELGYESGPPSTTPAQAPASLRSPLAVAIADLQVERLQIDRLAPLQGLKARLAVGAEGGALHRIEALGFDWERARIQASGQIGTGGTLPLQLAVQAQALGASLPWQGEVHAEGPLARPQARLTLRGEAREGHPAPALQAQAELAPFAAWPLAALSLTTQDLDLAAFTAQAPETRLSGAARIQSSGLDQPLLALVTLDNARPGRWDQARLPLQQLRLDLAGTPRHTDRLQLRQFTLALADERGPAGRIGGQGQWQGPSLDLALTLAEVQPARLDSRAAPLRLQGPLNLQLRNLPVASSPGAAPALVPVPGPQLALQARLTGQALDGSGLPVQLSLNLDGDAQQWRLRQAEAAAGSARAQLSGEARREAAGWRLQAQAGLQQFDPLPWWRGAADSPWRQGPHRLNGSLKAGLLWRDAPAPSRATPAAPALGRAEGELSLALADSQLAGVPLAVALALQQQAGRLAWDGRLQLADNRLVSAGEWPLAEGRQRGRAQLQAPALAAAAPLWRLLADAVPAAAGWLPSAGSASAEAEFDGRWPAWRSSGRAEVQGWRSQRASLARLEAGWRSGDDAQAPLALDLSARQLLIDQQRVDLAEAKLAGSLARHHLQLALSSPLKPPAWSETLIGPAGSGSRLTLDLQGQWQREAAGGSRWQVQRLSARGGPRDAAADERPWLAMQEVAGELRLDDEGRPLAATLAPGRIQLLSASVRWSAARWQRGGRPEDSELELNAELDTIHVASWLQRLQPGMGWSGNLDIGGRLQLRAGTRMEADVVLERQRGDLAVVDELGQRQALGLSELRLGLNVRDGLWQFAQGLAGQQIGEIVGAQVIRSTPGRRWPEAQAPMQGVLQARVANLGVWGAWVPPGWRLAGTLQTTATLGGRFGAPELSGELRGSGLGARNLLEGVNLSDGELAIRLQGDTARIERFSLRGGEGRMTVTGGATLGAEPVLALQLAAEQFRVLGRIDRRISTSGRAELRVSRGKVQLDGDFKVDEGLIDISRADAPRVDGDVQVRRAPPVASAPAASTATLPAGPPAAAAPPVAAASAPPAPPVAEVTLALRVGLGERLRLRGRGIDTGLRGELRLSSPGNRIALHGNVTTQGGSFAAYGQKLEIARGDIGFSGSPDSARLDVLALRPGLDVQVGVSVIGPLQNPRVRLVSEPEMAEMDKLSWLVLGRGPEGLGRTDTALLQRAAIALLAGDQDKGPTDQLIQSLGLTDFSVRQTDGEVRETIVSLGRQLSQRWYVGYERSVNATTGTWQLIYRAARRFTLRAQSGAENSVDLIWSWRW